MGTLSNGINYYGLSAVTQIVTIGGQCQWCMVSAPALSVQQAYSIDKKIDDGFPQTGSVTAFYVAGSTNNGEAWAGASDTSATQGTPSTCYDNGNSGSALQQYSLEENNGAGVNCALSFRFQ